MKKELDIRIKKLLGKVSFESSAIVQIRSLKSSGDSKVMLQIPVPVGEDASQINKVSVDPGLYEVSAILPSGDVLSRVIDVTEQDDSVDASLDFEQRTQKLISQVKLKEKADIQSTVIGKTKTETIPASISVLLIEVPKEATSFHQKLWDLVAKQPPDSDIQMFSDMNSIMPTQARTTSLKVKKIAGYLITNLPKRHRVNIGRAYLLVTLNNQTRLCMVPWPWKIVRTAQEALVKVVIEEEFSEFGDSEWSVRTKMDDNLMAGMLSYFAVGEQQLALKLTELTDARDMLFWKMVNPLAAAAGAYILIDQWIHASTASGSNEDWMTWVNNLYKFFPWLPDGAILNAWLALRARGHEPMLDEARTSLLEAVKRGIPVYSAGVKKLVDGLMLVSGEMKREGKIDTEIEMALARARQLAWQIDSHQLFTCIRLWNA